MKKLLLFLFLYLLISTAVFPQHITNTIGNSGLFSVKDGSTTFLSLSQSDGHLNLWRSLIIPSTTSSTVGIIFKGTYRFIHDYPGTNMNTFVGVNSGNFTMSGSGLYSSYNTAVGYSSLSYITSGYYNSAFGSQSLLNNTTGCRNSGFGSQSLLNNTTGSDNSAFGFQSLHENTTGYLNSSFGATSLYANTTGFYNSAYGFSSLRFNTTGNYNSAFGSYSLENNATGNYNSAFGHLSLLNNTTGSRNSAFGNFSLYYNSTGNNNTAFGYYAGQSLTTGSNNIIIGYNAQPSSASVNDEITLGNDFTTSLRCKVTSITYLSDARDKRNIEDLNLGLDFLMKIKPRQFKWDRRDWYESGIPDGSKMAQEPSAGFIAQELDEVQTTENVEWLNLVLKTNPDKWEATAGNLFPIVVKAIQELKTENDELKAEIEKLGEIKESLVEIQQLKKELNEQLTILKTYNKDEDIKFISVSK
jgi:hypothetical protein